MMIGSYEIRFFAHFPNAVDYTTMEFILVMNISPCIVREREPPTMNDIEYTAFDEPIIIVMEAFSADN